MLCTLLEIGVVMYEYYNFTDSSLFGEIEIGCNLQQIQLNGTLQVVFVYCLLLIIYYLLFTVEFLDLFYCLSFQSSATTMWLSSTVDNHYVVML